MRNPPFGFRQVPFFQTSYLQPQSNDPAAQGAFDDVQADYEENIQPTDDQGQPLFTHPDTYEAVEVVPMNPMPNVSTPQLSRVRQRSGAQPQGGQRSRADRSDPMFGSGPAPERATGIETGEWARTDDPAMEGVNSTLQQMLVNGKSREEVNTFLRSRGIDPSFPELENFYRWQGTREGQVWSRDPRRRAPHVDIDNRYVRQSGFGQLQAAVAASPVGGAVTGYLDTATLGSSDEIFGALETVRDMAVEGGNWSDHWDGNVNDIRISQDIIREQNPISSTIGSVAGGFAPWLRWSGMGRVGAGGQTGRAVVADGAFRGGVEGLGQGFIYGFNSGDGDLLTRLNSGAAGAAFGGPLGTVGGAAYGRVRSGFNERAANRALLAEPPLIGSDVLGAASRLNSSLGTNIQPLPAHVGGTPTRMIQAGTEATLFGGTQVSNAHRGFANETGRAANLLSNNPTGIPAYQTVDATADTLRTATGPTNFATAADRAFEGSSTLYDDAHRLARGAPLQTPNALRVLDETIARLLQRPGAESPQLPGLIKLREDLGAGNVTITGLRDLRTSQAVLFDARDGIQRGLGKRLWGALSDDIDTSLRTAGRADAADTFRRADTAFEGAINSRRVSDMILGDTPEDTIRAISNMTRTNVRDLDEAFRMMHPTEAANVRGSVVDLLGRARNGSQDGAGSRFSLDTFVTNYAAIPPAQRRALFPGQLGSDLADLSRLATAARDGGTFRNNSRTGLATGLTRTGTEAVGVGTAVLSGAAFGWSHVLLQWGGSALVGRILASPGAARRLVTMKNNRGAALRYLTALSNRNPSLRADLLALRAHVEQLPEDANGMPVQQQQPEQSAAPDAPQVAGDLPPGFVFEDWPEASTDLPPGFVAEEVAPAQPSTIADPRRSTAPPARNDNPPRVNEETGELPPGFVFEDE